MTRLRLFVPLILFLLICGVGYVGFSLNDRHQLPSALLDKPFPEFSAVSLLNVERRITKADLVGSPTLVNVWATWCPTCKSEHDELLRIAAGTDIQLVGVNYKDDITQAQNWLAQFGNPYDLVIVDADGTLGVELGVYGAPETFLLDRSGQVVFKRVGDVNPRIWRDELQPRFAQLGVDVDPALMSGL
ncbi:MAG: DsbE family thiol:disulfide interchange protein [Pseudomonadota bacterium]|nr:DsbE family thiol:disulfide interchange protein [Pseudomonadota bacterium]